MAGGALIDRVRGLLEYVPINETLLGGFGPAHMTAATASMAGSAVTLASLVDDSPFLHIGAALKHLRENGKACVQ